MLNRLGPVGSRSEPSRSRDPGRRDAAHRHPFRTIALTSKRAHVEAKKLGDGVRGGDGGPIRIQPLAVPSGVAATGIDSLDPWMC